MRLVYKLDPCSRAYERAAQPYAMKECECHGMDTGFADGMSNPTCKSRYYIPHVDSVVTLAPCVRCT